MLAADNGLKVVKCAQINSFGDDSDKPFDALLHEAHVDIWRPLASQRASRRLKG